MSGFVDLHLHSTFSDGVLTPAELVTAASAAGLSAIALSDHDNLDGVDEALAAGARHGLEVIPAVELSVVWQEYEDIHLLGYALDHRNPEFNLALREFRDFRANRSRKVLDNVNQRLVDEQKAPLDFREVQVRAGGTIGRPHIGRALLDAGYVQTMEDAFVRYLVPCNVAKRYFPLAEAIAMVHDAGGCAVLAHPLLIDVADHELPDLVKAFLPLGLDGLEVYSTSASNDDMDRLVTLARQHDLLVTGGSDFHQAEAGGVEIGRGRGNLRIPYRCVEEIKRRIRVLSDER